MADGIEGSRLRALRKQRGLTLEQLGNALGLTRSGVQKWEKDKSPVPSELAKPLARELGVTVAELYGEAPLHPDSNVVEVFDLRRLEAADVPIYAWGTCGPLEGEGAAEPVEWEPYPDDVEDDLGPAPIGVRVRGRSMTGRGIEPGSVCYVAAGRPAHPGQVVLVRAWSVDGTEAGMVVKVLEGDTLSSDGDDGREPYVVSRFEVIGPVLGVRAPVRRPRQARESTRRRPDMRPRAVKLEAARSALEALDRDQLVALLRELQQRLSTGAGASRGPIDRG